MKESRKKEWRKKEERNREGRKTQHQAKESCDVCVCEMEKYRQSIQRRSFDCLPASTKRWTKESKKTREWMNEMSWNSQDHHYHYSEHLFLCLSLSLFPSI